MNTIRFSASRHLHLARAEADLAITGWDRPTIELTLDGDPDEFTAEQQEDTLAVTSQAALALRIPRTISIHVEQVLGDLLLRDLDDEIIVDTARGDVSIRGGAAALSLQEVHGSLTAKGLSGLLTARQVHGDVQLFDLPDAHLAQVHSTVHARSVANCLDLGSVGGDISVRSISGALKIADVQGSLDAYDLRGGLEAGHIGGDLSLQAVPSPGQVYRAHAEGTIRAHFPAKTSARFNLKSETLVSADLPVLERKEPTHVVGQAGGGEAAVILQAGSDLWMRLQEKPDDESEAWHMLNSISARIGAEVAQHLGKMTVDAATQREIDNAVRKAEQELAQAQRQLERESQRAQELAHRAQEKAAQAARRAQERIARQSRSWGITTDRGLGLFGPPPPQRHNKPPVPSVSPDEQLAILKMLQENKISVQEAEALLKALEG